jgi:hypothetical protein
MRSKHQTVKIPKPLRTQHTLPHLTGARLHTYIQAFDRSRQLVAGTRYELGGKLVTI